MKEEKVRKSAINIAIGNIDVILSATDRDEDIRRENFQGVFKNIFEQNFFTALQLAEAINKSTSSIKRWANGDTTPPQSVKVPALKMVKRMLEDKKDI